MGFRRKSKKLWKWIKKHVRPDVGFSSFDEGEGPNWRDDDLYEISDKLKHNLRVGLKIEIRF